MTDRIEKAFYLNKEEFGILLDSKNCNSVNCLNIFGNRVEISDRKAYMSLYSMLNEGMIEIEDDKFSISDELNSIIATIASAKEAIAVYSPSYPSIAVYRADGSYVLTQQENCRNNNMKVSSIEAHSLTDMIVDKFRLNISESISVSEEIDESSDDMYFTSLLLLNCNDDFSKLASSDRTVILIDFLDLSKEEPYKKLAVIKHGIGLVTVVWSKTDVKTMPYEKSFLKKILIKDFLEVKYDNR